MSIFISQIFFLIRKQVTTQQKAVERKEMLLKRFTQHREEKQKRVELAKFRDCSYAPC